MAIVSSICSGILIASLFMLGTTKVYAQYGHPIYRPMSSMLRPDTGPPGTLNGDEKLGNGIEMVWHTSSAGVNWSVADCDSGYTLIGGGFAWGYVSSRTDQAATISAPNAAFTGWFVQMDTGGRPTAFATCEKF